MIHQRYRGTDGQADGQRDDMQSQDHALHYSASCGKNTIAYKMVIAFLSCLRVQVVS